MEDVGSAKPMWTGAPPDIPVLYYEDLEEGHLEHHVELHRRLRVVALEVRRERPRRREEDDVADDDREHERQGEQRRVEEALEAGVVVDRHQRREVPVGGAVGGEPRDHRDDRRPDHRDAPEVR